MINNFTDQGSAKEANAVFNELSTIASNASVGIELLRKDAYTSFERALVGLNRRRHGISRIPLDGVAYKFAVGDFYDTDQSNTTATVRADCGEVCLNEKSSPGGAGILSTTFTA